MVGVVLNVLLARRDDLPFSSGICGFKIADLRGRMASRLHEKIFAASRLRYSHIEAFVFLFIGDGIVFGIAPDSVSINAIVPLGLIFFYAVENSLIAGSPCY